MKNKVCTQVAVLCLLGFSVYVFQFVYYRVCVKKEANDCRVNSKTAVEVTAISRKSEDNPVVMLLVLEDVVNASIDKNSSKCVQLDRIARTFTMSEDFESNISEFLSAVRLSDSKGRDFTRWLRQKSMYKLLQYLTSRLKFVHTVCETGTYNQVFFIWNCNIFEQRDTLLYIRLPLHKRRLGKFNWLYVVTLTKLKDRLKYCIFCNT